MAACSKCGGMLKVMARSTSGCGIGQVDCDCVHTESPGKEPAPMLIHYPQEVIQALRTAGAVQQQALGRQAELVRGSGSG